MKKTGFLLIFAVLIGHFAGFGQDVSNKGKDFWLGYGYHVNMAGNPAGGGTQDMVLYFTSDKNANVTVEIPGVGYKQTYTVAANQVTTSSPIPKTGTQDARINTSGSSNRGIHVTSDVPIVAYAHIYNASVSGASLLFPTNTLGKDYYSINYTQSSNAANANSFFFVVATEDNTTVEITPSAANLNGLPAGVATQVTLNTGQVYNVMGTTSGNLGTDLTGSRIRSISSNGSGGCKKIAVFSGAGKMSIGGAGNAGGSADNLFAQAFPSVAWGKKYLTAPTGSQPNNFYRICVTDPTTVVKLNGTVLPASSLINSFYYQFKNGNASGANSPVPNLIEADKPVLVAQYCTTQALEGNPTGIGGDPEMIYLSPVEQTINSITLYSASKFQIVQSYINVIIKNGGVASFKLDGASKTSSFSAHPQDNNYSYATFTVASGSHTLYSDTGFNAIAYGFGSAESYGYNAGTNIRDFTPVATFQNPYNRIDSAVTCVNTPLQFSVPLTFQPTTIKWDFTGATNLASNPGVIGPLTSVTADSSKSVNGLTLNYYSTKSTYTFSGTTSGGSDVIKIYTTSATPDGCGSTDQVFTIPITVKGIPTADFSISNAGCVTDPVQLTDNSNGNGSPLARWIWDFADGTTSDLTSGSVFSKTYTSAGTGSYGVKLKVASDIGCISSQVTKTLSISTKPVASYTTPAITCVNDNITFTDASTIQVGSIAQWIWNLDNGAGDVTNNTNAAQTGTYTSNGTRNVTLKIVSSTGCASDVFAKSSFSVNPLPVVGFTIPEVCLSDASANFADTSKIIDGSEAQFTYLWGFNAGTPAVSPAPNTLSATVKSPAVKYNKAADYQVSLKVTSKDGCAATLVKPFTVNGSNPTASFTVQKISGLCSNDSVRLINTSIVDFGKVTRLDIYWDAIGTPAAKSPDEDPFINKSYANKYTNFQTPASKTYSVKLTAFSGNSSACSNSSTQIITVNRSPKVSLTTLPGICNEASARQITQASFDAQVPGTFAYSGNGVNATGLYDPVAAGAGSFPVKYLYTSDKGCQDSAIKNITVWPSPIAKWAVSTPTCQKNDLVFTDSSVAGYSNITSRVWNYDDGASTVTRTNANTYTRQFSIAKTNNISLQVFTDSGCKSRLNVQSIPIHPLPNVGFTLPSICLPDGRGQFINQTFISDGSEALFSYLWAFSDPSDPTPSTLKDPLHKYSALGPYSVKLKVTTKENCVDSLTQSLQTVYPQPKADFSITPSSVCVGDTIRLKDLGNGISSSAASWSWDLANGNSSTLQNPLKKFTDSGNFNIVYYFFNGQGCVSDTVTKTVTVYPYPKLTMGPNLKVLEGGVITIKPQYVYGTGLQYLWTPALYLNSDTAATPKSTPADDITYRLTLTGNGGCAVSDTVFIKVLKSPEVPNVFSPNGDGINDTWHIKYLESYPGAEVEVYNRYGQLVFQETGYDTEWNGTYRGSPLPVGTYYYIINPKNGRQIVKGSVTIIK